MMRLIDADKLLETLQDLEPHCENKDYERGMLNTMNYYMPKIINDEPTAYDMDKVVEQLEERKQEYLDGFVLHENNELYGVACGLGDAVKIVKQGSVSDDVCQWRLCDEEANVYDTSCRNPHILIEGTPIENNYKYCPYCGKKIKVVE